MALVLCLQGDPGPHGPGGGRGEPGNPVNKTRDLTINFHFPTWMNLSFVLVVTVILFLMFDIIIIW